MNNFNNNAAYSSPSGGAGNYSFLYSWRWFGPTDRITLNQIRQTGASGIVNALHQIPVGDVWTKEAILKRKKMIEDAGLTWIVVESLPVSEDIKKKSGNYLQHIENYKHSLRNLSECGIKTVCYNFMPILDWSRTNLKHIFDDGTYTSGFQYHIFAAFDLFILQREGAKNDYPEEVVKKAQDYLYNLPKEKVKELQDTILYGLPGSMETYTPEAFKEMLKSYEGIDRTMLKEHLSYFLNEIVPVAEEVGIKMAVHPDDPPWNLLGLPRIVSTCDDLKEIVNMIDSPSNGITLCTGSLGVGHFNDLTKIAAELAPHIHFVHLRNVVRDSSLNFQEETFFEGDIDMIGVVKVLVKEMQHRHAQTGEHVQLPVRPDHGHQILDDVGKENYPGYSLYGRMKNLAEIKGLTIGIMNMMKG
ncbi:mannonate dehydratase [Kiritimatiella glycovorans]|uniref:mannonate dehydratase n=1 Tax=Kiritimatiella glycovorans TaxID=1307763 RepID=UPI0009E25CD8|nr:mannonate dehydratase [Kiritimatiella glycovorans]